MSGSSDASRAVKLVLMPKSQRRSAALLSFLSPTLPLIRTALQHVPSPIHLASDSFVDSILLSITSLSMLITPSNFF